MLISIKEIKKLQQKNIGKEIITYFYRWRGHGYNTYDLVYLPKTLAKKTKKLLNS